MSPSRKRSAAESLQEEFSVSERRACEVVDQPRSTQRYEAQPREDESALAKRMSGRGAPTSAVGLSPGGLAASPGSMESQRHVGSTACGVGRG